VVDDSGDGGDGGDGDWRFSRSVMGHGLWTSTWRWS